MKQLVGFLATNGQMTCYMRPTQKCTDFLLKVLTNLSVVVSIVAFCVVLGRVRVPLSKTMKHRFLKILIFLKH